MHTLKKLSAAMAMACVAQFTHADGILEGRITDQGSSSPINGVVIHVKELDRRLLVNSKGFYRLTQLPPGQYTIEATLSEQMVYNGTVTIVDESVVTNDISIDWQHSDIEEVMVTGQAAQIQRALDKQRYADNVISAVNSDAIGKLPDINAAEALQRVPGISIERDQGEGRFVRVRGISPDLNAVTIDGTQLPAPEAGRRAVALDVIPSDLISSLIVTKALTPDMDANAIGGSIEVEGISALDKEGLFYTVNASSAYAEHTKETSPSMAVTGGNQIEFGDGSRLGFASAFTYDQRKFGSDNVETGAKWDGSELEEVEQRDYTLTRERVGAALNLDYEFDKSNSIYLHTLYSEYSDDEQRLANVVEFGEMVFDDDEGEDVFEGVGRPEGDTGLAEINRELKDRKETQTILSTTLGGEHFRDNWTIDYALGYSKANEDEPGGISGAVFKQEEVDGMGFNNTRQPNLIVSDAFLDASLYELDEIEYEEALTEDVQTSAKLDITRDFDLNDYPAFVKFGAKHSQRTKNQALDVYKFEDLTDNGFTSSQLTQDQFTNGSVNYELGQFGPNINSSAIKDVMNQLNKADFIDVKDSAIEDFEISEDIQAAYVMGRIEMDETLFIGGMRYEGTKQAFKGYQYDDETETISDTYSENEYEHILPSFHARHILNDATQLRFAYTQAVVRPTFEQMSPGTSTEGPEGNQEIEKGNPDLKAMESSNIDLGVEHFMGEAGVLSAFLFHKNIRHFTYETMLTEINPLNTDELTEISTFANGDDATLTGIELAYSQKLAMLPAPFNELLVGLNVTYSESEAQVSAQEEDGGSVVTNSRAITLPNQSDVTGNAILGYETERFMIRIAANYKSEYLLEVNDPLKPEEDVYQASQTQVDISAAYHVLENLKLTFDISNITDEPYYTYQNSEAFNAQYEEYGPTYRLGVSFHQF